MVDLILTESQVASLKAAVPIGSREWAALEKGEPFGSTVFKPAPIVVTCAMTIANRLLAVAEEFCPDAVPEIRAAIAQGMQ